MSKGPSANRIEMFPGVSRRRLAATDQLYQMAVDLAAGAVVPMHQHPHEQISYVVSGRLRFQLGDSQVEAGPGESVLIPGELPHAVWALTDCLVVDTFSPCRTEYLAADGD
jgi:quercetin dioxygenase-like cupin family protein